MPQHTAIASEIMNLTDLQPQLKAWFPPNAHKERALPGGGKWFFIPWQTIRDRLDEIYPDWTATYSDPIVAADYLVIRCRLTIAGVTREGVGNDQAYPDKKTYGTPVERAIADAFKNAAEQFGIAAYLDEQTGDRQKFIQYMRKGGDNRAFVAASQNGWTQGSLATKSESKRRGQEERQRQRDRFSEKLNTVQINQIWQAAQGAGHNKESLQALTKQELGYKSSREIPASKFQQVMELASRQWAAA